MSKTVGNKAPVMSDSFKLVDNPQKRRFEYHLNDEIAIIEYIQAQDRIYLTHTEVPIALRSGGIGSKLAVFALNEVESRGLKLVPLCPFVAAYIKRHPEWKRILMDGVNV